MRPPYLLGTCNAGQRNTPMALARGRHPPYARTRVLLVVAKIIIIVIKVLKYVFYFIDFLRVQITYKFLI